MRFDYRAGVHGSRLVCVCACKYVCVISHVHTYLWYICDASMEWRFENSTTPVPFSLHTPSTHPPHPSTHPPHTLLHPLHLPYQPYVGPSCRGTKCTWTGEQRPSPNCSQTAAMWVGVGLVHTTLKVCYAAPSSTNLWALKFESLSHDSWKWQIFWNYMIHGNVAIVTSNVKVIQSQ